MVVLVNEEWINQITEETKEWIVQLIIRETKSFLSDVVCNS